MGFGLEAPDTEQNTIGSLVQTLYAHGAVG